MSRFVPRLDAIATIALFAMTLPAQAVLTPLWQVGIDNGTQTEFVQESFSSNAAPGSATVKDDDWYFAGTYPSPIGTLATDEATSLFERALVDSDPRNRIHFNLTQEQTNDNFQLCADIVGTRILNDGIPFRMLFNGNVVFQTTNVTANGLLFSAVFSGLAVGAVAGENIVTLERDTTPGEDWLQFDFIRLDSQVVTIPEPATASLALLGLGA